jgi:hypothetical protein
MNLAFKKANFICFGDIGGIRSSGKVGLPDENKDSMIFSAGINLFDI